MTTRENSTHKAGIWNITMKFEGLDRTERAHCEERFEFHLHNIMHTGQEVEF